LHKPLFGYGFAVPTGDVLGRIYWNDLASNHVFHDLSRIFNVHNQYINAALSTGLPGLALFIGFLYFLIRNGIRDLLKQGRKRRRMFFTAMLSINVSLVVVCSFANGPHLASGSMANYFWITLGLTHAIRDHNIEI
jgi:O-antigen ligase